MVRRGFLREFGFGNLFLAFLWIGLIGTGLVILLDYGTRPGRQTDQLPYWPDECAIQRSTQRPTVVMFAHPHCPCTRASVAELEKVVANCHSNAEFRVVAFAPLHSDTSWRESDLIASARSIPGVTVYWDDGGREARRFSVTTSGHVVTYDADGRLKFSGGITGSRGHQGSNFGRTNLENWLRTSGRERTREHAGDPKCIKFPVFGCGLVNGADPTNE